MMTPRNDYLNKLIAPKDVPVITMVPSLNKDHNGIREISLREFLTEG